MLLINLGLLRETYCNHLLYKKKKKKSDLQILVFATSHSKALVMMLFEKWKVILVVSWKVWME